MPTAVILTALEVEYLAVRAHLQDARGERHPRGTLYEVGRFAQDGHVWTVGIAQVGAGNASSAVEAERAIGHFSPDVALFVGVAGGIKDVRLGDVVAATKVYGYHAGKSGESFMPRPDVGRASYGLVQRAREVARKLDWQRRIDLVAGGPPKALVAPIAAGEQVVADTAAETFQLLQASYSDAVAVEMEGRGFLEAAYASGDLPALVVRGISDLIDEKGMADSAGFQAVASRHAAAFAFELLGRFYEDIPSRNEKAAGLGGREDQLGWVLASAGQSQLPALASPLVGREQELAQIADALRTGQSILLHGMGGIGKTSVALEAARRLRSGNESRPVVWAEPPDTSTIDALCDAVARDLGDDSVAGIAGAAKLKAVRELLDRHARLVIFLDDPARPEIGDTFIKKCLPAGLALVATSRRQHHGFPVNLSIRPLDRDAAIELFAEHSRVESDVTVGKICDLLETHPLALVIAAGRVRAEAMPLQNLYQRLVDEKARLDTLRLPEADDSGRNVRASLNVSWADLSQDQRHVLTRLSAFYSDTTLELLAHATRFSLIECEDRVGELVSRSLVERVGQRLHLHQLVRDFGRGVLGTDLRSAQAYAWEAIVDFVQRYDRDTPEHHDKLEEELGNIVGAVRHLASLDPESGIVTVPILEPLTHDASVLQRRGYESLRVDLARLGLRMAERLVGHEDVLVAMLYRCASALGEQGSRDEAVRMFRRCLGLSEKLGQLDRVASVLLKLGNLALSAGRVDRARQHYSKSLGISTELVDAVGIAAAQGQLGGLALRSGDLSEAARLYGDSLNLYRRQGHLEGMAACLHSLGEIAERVGNNGQAREWFLQSLQIERQIGNIRGIAVSLRNLLGITSDPDDFTQAMDLYHQILVNYRERGNLEGEAGVLHEMGGVAWRQRDLGDAERLYRESLLIRRGMGDSHGIAVTLGQLGRVAHANGNADAARAYTEDSASQYARAGVKHGVALCSFQLGQFAESDGDPARARAHYEDSFSRWKTLNSPEAEMARAARDQLQKSN